MMSRYLHGLPSSVISANIKHYDVIIVGAGASGLAAAKELEANEIMSILILEASDRIGGRIRTIKPPSGGFFEIGAQWIHGQKDNELYSQTAPRGLIGEYVSVDGEGDFYTDKGEKIATDLLTEVMDIIQDIKKECQELIYSDSGPQLSVGSYFGARFEEYLHGGSKFPHEREIKRALYHWFMRWERIDNACDSLHQLSAKRWEYFACRGFYNMNPKYGMSSLIESIREDIQASIKLNTEVIQINYAEKVTEVEGEYYKREDGTYPVIIKCRNGMSYACNHVIVTSSLGYLKRYKYQLFWPPLASNFDRAIENLGFGVIDKIFLEFEEPFWDSNFTGIHLVWTSNEIPDFNRDKPDSRLIDGRTIKLEDFWYRAITGFDPIYGHKSTLCGWIGGPEAVFMESLSEEEVGNVCKSLIQKFTKKTIPNPIRVYRSQWSKEEYVLGSYSHRLNSSDHLKYDLIRDMNSPISATSSTKDFKVPLIVFAGEAYNSTFYSTVHGAMSNGRSQANHYIQFVKKFEDRRRKKSKL